MHNFQLIVNSTELLNRNFPKRKLESRLFAFGRVLQVRVTELACTQGKHNALFKDTLD